MVRELLSAVRCRSLILILLLFAGGAGLLSAQTLDDSLKDLRVEEDSAGVPSVVMQDTLPAAKRDTVIEVLTLKNAQQAMPYYQSWQNPWYIYSGRYQQFIDVLRPTDLMVSRILALTHRPGNQPYEQSKVYFPGPTCVYLDGRFLAYIENQTIDLNKLTPYFERYAAFYVNPSYQELMARTGKPDQRKLTSENGRPPYRRNRDGLLAGSFTLLMTLLLGTRGRAFYRIFSLRSLLLQPEQALPGQGPEVIGWQTLLHVGITVLCTSVFLYCYRYGVDPVLLQYGAGNGGRNAETLFSLMGGTLMYLLGLAVYVYGIGLALFNIRMEGSHVRGNLEVFSIGSVLLAVWALLWNFTGVATFEVFRMASVYFCLILFCVKGFLMYKILVSDQGFRKFYALSYICLTELLPSILLIRQLTDL